MEEGPPAIARHGGIARRLRQEGVSGILFFTDDSCRLWGLTLPSLDWLRQRSSRSGSCTFSLTPDGRQRFVGERVAFSSHGDAAAACRSGRVDVFTQTGRPRFQIEGFCVPAWKPDGTLTVVSEDGIFAFPLECNGDRYPCAVPILTKFALLATLRSVASSRPSTASVPEEIRDPEVEEVAWLSDSRFALTASFSYAGGREALVAVFEGGRLTARPTIAARFDDLRVSPRRRYIVVRSSGPRGLFFFDRDGRLVARNPVASGHHAAWSPDERWIAVATGGSTYLIRTEELVALGRGEHPRLLRIPVFAADLAWR